MPLYGVYVNANFYIILATVVRIVRIVRIWVNRLPNAGRGKFESIQVFV
jgi:hypothetical protein